MWFGIAREKKGGEREVDGKELRVFNRYLPTYTSIPPDFQRLFAEVFAHTFVPT